MEDKIIRAKRSNLVLAYVKVNFPKKILKKRKIDQNIILYKHKLL